MAGRQWSARCQSLRLGESREIDKEVPQRGGFGGGQESLFLPGKPRWQAGTGCAGCCWGRRAVRCPPGVGVRAFQVASPERSAPGCQHPCEHVSWEGVVWRTGQAMKPGEHASCGCPCFSSTTFCPMEGGSVSQQGKVQLRCGLLEPALGEAAWDLGPCVSLRGDVGCISKILQSNSAKGLSLCFAEW